MHIIKGVSMRGFFRNPVEQKLDQGQLTEKGSPNRMLPRF